MDTTSGSSASTSEYASTPGSSMSVQAYTSQFIKEGLRIKMRQKMGSGGSEISGTLPGLPSPTRSPTAATATAAWESEGSKTPPGSKLAVKRINVNELAPQDAVRRLRRRERNKVAATKCRNKKKARTGILMKVNFLSWIKVIYPKYSKHWHYNVAHTIDCVCSKMLNHGLNPGLFLSLFKLIPCHIDWIVYLLAYLNFIFEF